MSTILILLALGFFVLLVIGFFSPKSSLFWLNSGQTRRKSFFVNGGCALFCFVAFGATLPPQESTGKKSVNFSKKSPNEKDETLYEASEATSKLNYNKIGDQIQVGNFSYRVNKIRFAKVLGNEFSKQRADGIYLVVHLTFKNNDSEEHTLDNSFFKLTDEHNTEFSNSSEAEVALEMTGQETLFLKQCNPRITKSGYLVFEVPEEGTYDLHLSGGFWNGNTAAVKLVTQ